jgi:lipoprotein NlpI
LIQAYYNRGVIYFNQGDRSTARIDFQQSANLALNQGNDQAYQQAIDMLKMSNKQCRQSINTLCDW